MPGRQMRRLQTRSAMLPAARAPAAAHARRARRKVVDPAQWDACPGLSPRMKEVDLIYVEEGLIVPNQSPRYGTTIKQDPGVQCAAEPSIQEGV